MATGARPPSSTRPAGPPRLRVFALGLLVLVAGLAPFVGVGAAASTGTGTHASAPATTDAPATDRAAEPGINLTFYTSLTPAEPGEVRTRVRFTVPEDVTSLTARVPEDVTVTGTEGFRQRAPRRYEWTRQRDRPSLTMTVPANVTVQRGRGTTATEGFVFVDTGDWALVRAPGLAGLTYSGLGERAPVRREQVVNGSGAAGETMLFLGPVERHTRETAGQRLRLVVPEAADLRESPDDVLDALAAADRALSFGPRDGSVFVVAAPTDGVPYASTGLQRGDADVWVRDVQRLDSPENVWVHEYVHTRQTYRSTNRTRWTGEGMADYYAASRALETGRINYSQFRRHLNVGARGRFGDAVLANESTWRGTTANYWKGALVFAALDRRIRVGSDGEATLQDAIRRAQTRSGDRLNESTFLDSVGAVGGADARAFARRHTRTDATPATWNRSEHARVFGGLADISYRFDEFRVEGPYRNGTLDRPVVVPGETLLVRAVATNGGDRAGNYTATLRAGSQPVETRRGRLAVDESVELDYRVPFDSSGDPVLALGGARREVGVVTPASPRVTGLRVPDRARTGEALRLRATVRNPADRPADGRVALRVDGEVVHERRARLAPGGSTTLTATATFERAGEYTVRAGDERATVRVDASTATPTDGRTTAGAGPATDTPTTAARTGAGTPTSTPGTDGNGGGPTPGGATATTGDVSGADGGTATTGSGSGSAGDGTPSSVDGPGFGAGVALLGVLAWLLARRRAGGS